MGGKAAFTVVHSCGHSWSHDLSAKPGAERSGFARLLAWTPCDKCSGLTRDSEESTPALETEAVPDRSLATGR